MNIKKHQRMPLAGEGPRKTNPYASRFNRHLAASKQTTPTIPLEAKRAGHYLRDGALEGPYPVCLPREFADHNLLPDVRDDALALFVELDIPWHDSVDGGPSNHLRDSQVQCVNALFPMVAEPGRIRRAFGHLIDIAEVLPIEDGRFLTFEYIGPTDYFGEGVRDGVEVGRRRGTNCTSVDAAFRYQTSDGITELALVEWKFTESYLRALPRKAASDAVRIGRYGTGLTPSDSPVAADILPVELLLDEPFYQLVRQQLLAHRLEADHVLGADVVRVLHVLAPDNSGYQDSLARAEHRAIGSTVDEVWAKLLRAPDRFVHVDPAVFLDPEITSADYVARYSLGATGA